MFDDTHQILDFISVQETSHGMSIDEGEHKKTFSDISNIILKSVINLENFYNLQYKFRKTTNCNT